jgi:hypothetical protein
MNHPIEYSPFSHIAGKENGKKKKMAHIVWNILTLFLN